MGCEICETVLGYARMTDKDATVMESPPLGDVVYVNRYIMGWEIMR